MSEIGKLIKSNGLTWAQIEAYLVSKNTNPATISNLQCVFEEETGISQPAYSTPDIGSDGTSIYSEEYNGTFLDSPDNIFQESDAMDNRPKISQKDRDMLVNIIYDIKGGVVDVTPDNTPDNRLKDSPSEAFNQIVQDKTNQELMGTTEISNDSTGESVVLHNEEPVSESYTENEFTNYTPYSQQDSTYESNIYNQSENSINENNYITPQTNFGLEGQNLSNFNDIVVPNDFTTNNIFNNTWNAGGFGFNMMNNFFITPNSFGFNGINNPYKIVIPNITGSNFTIPPINSNPNSIEIPSISDIKPDKEQIKEPDKKSEQEAETYPKLLQDRIDELTRTGNTFEVTGDSKTGYTILVTAGEYLDNAKIKSIKFYLNKEGALTSQIIKYKNGEGSFIDYTKGRRAITLKGDYGEIDDLMKFMDIAKDNPSENTTVDFNKDEKLYTVTQTGFSKDSDITQIVTTMSTEPWQDKLEGKKDSETNIKKEDYIVKQVITYKDGTVKTFIYEEGKVISETTSSTEEDTPDKLYTAVDISFDIPKDASSDAKQFTDELVSKKAKLMKELNLDNDTYNMLAQIAIGLAGQETDMNQSPKLIKKSIERSLCENTGIIGEKVKDLAGKKYWSRGMTQIKYGMYVQEPFCKKQFEKFGINSEEDLEDPQKSAIATMIVLTSKNNLLENDTWKTRMAQYDDNHLSTKEDALIVLFHGWAKQVTALKEGRLDASKQEYLNNVKGYMSNYKLVEDADSRAKAIEAEKLRREEEAKEKPYENLDNSGPIGAVLFMPKIYIDGPRHTNTEKEIKALEAKLNEKKVDKDVTDKLIKALENNDLSFDFGLRESEMDALTEDDIKLILKHLDEIRASVKDVTNSGKINSKESKNSLNKYAEKIATEEKEFKKEYMNKHSKVYDVSDDNPQVLRGISTEKHESRHGFTHEKSKGVNTKTTTGTIRKTDEVLAKSADKVANSNKKGESGYCLNGVKTAMEQAGIDVSEMTKYGNTPKYAKNWFDMMVSKGLMVQVKYVEVSAGKGRAINNSDIETLPAGYIGLFLPDLDGGYQKEAGHSFITNGYGQGNADMTDNLDWANYRSSDKSSGKGEHGTFYIYKLSDKWVVGEDGKLKVKK